MADTDILRVTRKWRLYVEANLGGSGANIDPGTIEGQAARWDNTGSVWEPVNETAFGAVRDMYIGIPVNEGKLIFVGTISNLADERAHVGFDGSSLEFEIKNLTASSSITIKATDAGLNEITFLNANPNGDTLLRGDTGLRLESSSGVIEMEPGGNGYFEFNSAGILDMLGNGVQSGVLRITEGVSPFGDVAGRGQLWADSADSRIKWTDDGGTDNTLAYLTDITGGTPGGADTNVQFNNAGAFGGSADFTWNGARLGFTNAIGINWEDLMGVEVEHLIFEEVAFGASPIAASTELYVDWDGMAGDTTFVDDDGNTWNQRNASAVISSFAKFGPGSMVIQNGTVGGFGSSDPSFPNFSGDFSFGFWYYLDDDDLSSSFTGGNTIFGRRNTGATGGWRWRVLINNGNLSFNYRVGSPGSENRFRQFGPATVREQWLYCVVERDGGVIRAYVGGSQVGSDVNDSDTLFMGGGDTQVSAEGFSGIDDDFYVDDITILDGATVYAGGGGGEPPGDPANPSGDFETFVVGDPVYRTLIDGEDVFLGKQSEQVARTTDAASGGFLVNNTLTGSGFERVLTRSDVGGGSNDGDMIEWDDTAGEFVVSPTVAAADHGITVFGAGAGGVTNTRIEFRDGLPGSTRNFYIGPVGSNQVDIVSENVAGRSIRIAGDDGSLVQRVGLNFVPGSTTVLRATTQLILQSNDGTKVFDGSASGSGSVWSGGAEKITAFSDGAVIRGSAANSVNVRMAGSGGSTLTQIRHNASNTCLFDNTITNPGVAFRFQGEDVATITRTMMEMNPNTGPSFFESGVEVARVLPAASGGFEVNNTLTGAGFERVITESDFGAGEVIEKVKNVSTTRSSTGVSDDPELSGWALTAGYWRFYGSITFTVTPSNGGIDLNWSTIGGSLGINFGTILTRDDTGVSVGGCIEGAFIPGNVSDLTITYATRNDQTRAFIHGQIEVASGTVTVGFQWAPRLAASQTVGEGSWIRFQKTN